MTYAMVVCSVLKEKGKTKYCNIIIFTEQPEGFFLLLFQSEVYKIYF